MTDMQDNPQSEGLAQGGNTQDPNSTDGSNQATGADQSQVQQKSDQASTIDPKAYSKLQSDYQAMVGRMRQLQGERSTERQQYEQKSQALASRVEQLEKSFQQQQPKATEPDFGSMDNRQIMEYLENKAAEKAMKQWQEQQTQFQAQQQQQQMDQQRQQEEERYQSRWDELQKSDPSVNVKEVEDFMIQNRVYDPIFAYNFLYSDMLTKQAVAEAQKATVSKIASNQKTQTEGAGKAGIIPPPPDKKFANKRERNNFIIEQYNARQGAQQAY